VNYTDKQIKAIKELLFKIADDELIIGHRNSEWTGLGPILEEDIAFSSIAQDKLGQSLAVYNILHELGEDEPDELAFGRSENEFKCCHLTEYPNGEYDFSLMRHFLFSHAENLRYEMLAESFFKPIEKIAKKFRGEIKYHVMHADTWIKQLGEGTEESKSRIQKALDDSFNLALGIFEHGNYENELGEMKVFEGEEILQNKWLEAVKPVLENSGLKIPERGTWNPSYGGRNGKHTEYLKPLLEEMTEVFRIDPEAEW
jgi:ring-1,2-phenylacetyl-CoA epoxidase subunit PaaC